MLNRKEELEVAEREEGCEFRTVRCPRGQQSTGVGAVPGYGASGIPLKHHRVHVSSQRVVELENSYLTVASREINRCRQFHTFL